MKQKMMRGADFKKYFDGVVDAVVTTKGARGESISIADVMKEHGLQMPDLPKPLADKIMPLLETDMQEITAKRGIRGEGARECNYCEACSICEACDELNAAAGGAHSASLLAILPD